jgi:hypothetical protein
MTEFTDPEDSESVLRDCKGKLCEVLAELDSNGFHLVAAYLSQVIDMIDGHLS